MLINALKKAGIIIAGLIILGTILLIIGYIIDLVNYPILKRMGQEALSELKASQIDGEDNAWNYYNKAIEMMEKYNQSINLKSYAAGEVPFNGEIRKELEDNREVINMVMEGSKKSICSIPTEYERGWFAPLPNFARLQNISKIITAMSLNDFENGRITEGLSIVYRGLAYSKNIINGNRLLITHLVGIALIRDQLTIINFGLASGQFDRRHLKEIVVTLNGLENDVPPLWRAVEGDLLTGIITFSRISPSNPFRSLLNAQVGVRQSLGERLLCWRYVFSPWLTVIKAFKFWEKIVMFIASKEKSFMSKTEAERNMTYFIDENAIKKYTKTNPIFALLLPNYYSFIKRKLDLNANIRMLKLASQLWLYRINNGDFPTSLEEIDGDVIFDPYIGDVWRYTYAKDTITVSSPGNNLTYGDFDDISITLRKSSIEDYLLKEGIRKKTLKKSILPGHRFPKEGD